MGVFFNYYYWFINFIQKATAWVGGEKIYSGGGWTSGMHTLCSCAEANTEWKMLWWGQWFDPRLQQQIEEHAPSIKPRVGSQIYLCVRQFLRYLHKDHNVLSPLR